VRETTGDIWDYDRGSLIVVPTTIGWRFDGKNVMGAGLAKEASEKYIGLAGWYGSVCKFFRDVTPVIRYSYSSIICFPTKPLCVDNPSRSWAQDSDLELVARSARELGAWYKQTQWKGEIAVPMVGCGNGKLRERDVLQILRAYLNDNRFVLVRR